MEILTPPSDHITLRRRCAFGWSDPAPNDPVLRGQRAGPLAAGVRKRTFKEAFPPQWLVGVDRLRCKWLNLKSATLMFFKSTQGRKGNLLIPITAPLRLLPGD
jgi:hypothetical protein